MVVTALLLFLASTTINDCYAQRRGPPAASNASRSHKAIPESFPYIVAIAYEMSNPFCVGTLISKEFILTAANCVTYPAKMLLYLGSRNPEKYSEEGRVIRTVDLRDTKVFKDPNEGPNMVGIALIKLPQAVEPTERIQPIRLVQRSLSLRNMTNLLGYGWAYPRSEVMERGYGLVFPDDHCRHVYGFYYRPKKCCEHGRRIIACQGFSGSPLVVLDRNGTMRLVAIAAYRYYTDCNEDIPVSYVRIASYLDWIKNNTGVEIEE